MNMGSQNAQTGQDASFKVAICTIENGFMYVCMQIFACFSCG